MSSTETFFVGLAALFGCSLGSSIQLGCMGGVDS